MFLRAVTVLDSRTRLGTSMASPFTTREFVLALTLEFVPLSTPAWMPLTLALPLALPLTLALARALLLTLGERAFERSPLYVCA